MLVLTGMDYSKKDDLYEQAKRSLPKFNGEQLGGGKRGGDKAGAAIKLEPVFFTNEEEAFAAGLIKRPQSQAEVKEAGVGKGANKGKWRGRGYGRGNGGYGRSNGGYEGGQANAQMKWNDPGKSKKARGLLIQQGQMACSCYVVHMHHIGNWWPYALTAGKSCHKFTWWMKLFFSRELCVEAWNCAVLDCACSSTVCGDKWLEGYLANLEPEVRARVKQYPGQKVFKFGGGSNPQDCIAFLLC